MAGNVVKAACRDLNGYFQEFADVGRACCAPKASDMAESIVAVVDAHDVVIYSLDG